jgi:hypothetical protein
MKLFGSDFVGSLKDAGLGFAGFYAQKVLHEKIVEPQLLKSVRSFNPEDVQLVLNILGVVFTAPVVGKFIGGNFVTVGGTIWHFARGLKIVLSKLNIALESYSPFLTPIPF